MKSKITIGTRSSKLALWQANFVQEELQKLFPDIEIRLKEIKTKGDHITNVALSKIGGKGLFTKEIEDELLKNKIDVAVHSLKDLPTKLPTGLKIGAVLKREQPNDVLISTGGKKFNELPSKSKVGTSSLRRIAQLKSIRPDIIYLDLRGNLDTRIRKLEEGKYDAIVAAYAGVKRLGFEKLITEHFSPEEILPAVGQGSLAIETRETDKETNDIVLKLNHKETFLISLVERAFLEFLQGGCQVPIGAYSKIRNNKIIMTGIIASLDGEKIVKDTILASLDIKTAKFVGKKLGQRLLHLGGKEILEGIIRTS